MPRRGILESLSPCPNGLRATDAASRVSLGLDGRALLTTALHSALARRIPVILVAFFFLENARP